MTFKIKDGVAIGTANVFNNSGQLTTPQIKDAGSAFAVSLTPTTLTANRTYTLPDKAGTIAMTSDITSAVKATATTLGLVELADNAVQTTAANAVTTTASRTYGIQLNGNDQAVVNVPWTDTTYAKATSTVLGLVELWDNAVQTVAANAVSTTASRTYGLQLNGNDQAVVNVPWTDTTYAKATATVLGLVELGDNTVQTVAANAVSTTASRSYAVQLNAADQMVVNVPWVDTDTNTTYSISSVTTTGGAFLRLTAGGSGSGTDDVKFTGGGIATVAFTDADTITITATEADTLQTVTGRGATSSVATVSLTGGTASTTTGTGTLVVTGGVGISGALNVGGAAAVGGNLTVTGDLTVNGTTTTVNSTTITVDDKNLELGSVASPTDVTADGGGITLKGTTDKTFNWVDATDAWTSSEHLAVAAGKTLRVSGSTSGTTIIQATAIAGSGTLTLPTATGTIALTSDIPTVNNGTLGAAAVSAGATNTTVALNFSAAYSANTASNVTVNPVVGPALTALASTMTGAGTGFLRKNGADTYSLDTNTYLTANQSISLTGDITGTGTTSIATTLATVNSNIGTFNNVTVNAKGLVTSASNVTYLTAEADTLATVTGRGATTGTAITLTNATNSTSVSTGALVVTGGVAINADLVVKGNSVDTTSGGTIIAARTAVQATVATVSATAVDTWAIATYRSAKYVVQITQGSNYQVSEVLVIHNGTTTFMTEYAVLETNGALGTFTTDISSGNGRLIVTMGSATSATINIQRTLVVV
jgi:hypothetical protein